MKYALALLLAVAACKGENVKANVDCTVNAGPTIDCVVKQTQGKSEIDVCWDISGSCPNGATLKAERTCQKVKDGGSATVTIPTAKITLGGPTCDANPTVKLENMTINGEKSTI